MLNPEMKARGLFEFYRQQYEEVKAAAERNKPEPVQSMPQPGSVEWFEMLHEKRLKG